MNGGSMKRESIALVSAVALAVFSATSASAQSKSDWAGFYAGLHGGYGWGDLSADEADGFVKLKGGVGGGHIGYLWQFQSFVLGVEGDISYSAIGEKLHEVDGPETYDFEAKNNWLASLRARAGVDVGPALLYATGGLAWTDWSITETSRMAGFDDVKGFKTGGKDLGFVVGGGVEFKLTQSIVARVEGLHYRFSGMDVAFEDDGELETVKLKEEITTVRGGLSVRF